jgi:hypothetical protein
MIQHIWFNRLRNFARIPRKVVVEVSSKKPTLSLKSLNA